LNIFLIFLLGPVWAIAGFGIVFVFPIINEFAILKKGFVSLSIGMLIFYKLKLMNRSHFENIINPYFEKYNIK